VIQTAYSCEFATPRGNKTRKKPTFVTFTSLQKDHTDIKCPKILKIYFSIIFMDVNVCRYFPVVLSSPCREHVTAMKHLFCSVLVYLSYIIPLSRTYSKGPYYISVPLQLRWGKKSPYLEDLLWAVVQMAHCNISRSDYKRPSQLDVRCGTRRVTETATPVHYGCH
jgi:hypothetical protein